MLFIRRGKRGVPCDVSHRTLGVVTGERPGSVEHTPPSRPLPVTRDGRACGGRKPTSPRGTNGPGEQCPYRRWVGVENWVGCLQWTTTDTDSRSEGYSNGRERKTSSTVFSMGTLSHRGRPPSSTPVPRATPRVPDEGVLVEVVVISP